MRRCKFAAVMLVFAVMSGVSANEINDFSVNENGVFTVNGSVGGTENVNLFVNSSENGEIAAIKQTKSENGKYTFSVALEEAVEKGGKFKFKTVPQTEDAAYGEIEYYTRAERRSAAEKLAEVSQEEDKQAAAEKIIEENFDVLSFNCPEFKTLVNNGKTKELAQIIISFSVTEENLSPSMRKAAGTVAIGFSKNESEIKDIFEKYKTDIKPENSELYAKLEDKTVLYKQLAKSETVYESMEDFYKKLDNAVILAEFNSARGTDGCYAVLAKYSDTFDLSTYNRSDNNKTAMLKKLLEESENGNTESIEQIQKILDTKIPNEESGNKGGSGGGRGSSSGSGYTAPAMPKISYDETDTVIPENVFTDIDGYEWARADIEELAKSGVLNGVGKNTFAPAENVTRAEVSKMVCKLLGIDEESGESKFADVNTDDWFCGYVKALAAKNIINGVNEKEFKPEEYISRQDFAAMLQRALDITAQETEESFSDVDTIADYAREAALALKSAGILQGDEQGRFNPKSCTARAEAAVMINRSLKYLNGGR